MVHAAALRIPSLPEAPPRLCRWRAAGGYGELRPQGVRTPRGEAPACGPPPVVARKGRRGRQDRQDLRRKDVAVVWDKSLKYSLFRAAARPRFFTVHQFYYNNFFGRTIYKIIIFAKIYL